MNWKYIVGIGIILIFIVFGALSFRKNMTPYVGFKEAMSSNSSVQIIGEVIPEDTRYDLESHQFFFSLKDPKGEKMKVAFNGVKPANFEQATSVVAIGKYQDGLFSADQILVKCPSKYQGGK
ncbi:MAG TPA: cytochrome c maturation protein CcmE [Terriglobales bacterium]|nr:cytochrome c maturation protein CcmE [Terriglobales bacterium]